MAGQRKLRCKLILKSVIDKTKKGNLSTGTLSLLMMPQKPGLLNQTPSVGMGYLPVGYWSQRPPGPSQIIQVLATALGRSAGLDGKNPFAEDTTHCGCRT